MSVPSQTLLTYTQIGRREDLSDLIDDISPTERPFTSSIKQGKATNTLHEWLMDKLVPAAANRVLSGDDATTDATSQPQRLHTFTQISDKVASVAGSAQASNLAGRDDEMGRAMARKIEEMMLDIEFMLTNRAGVANAALPSENAAGAAGSVRATAAYQTWMGPNTALRNGAGAAAAGISTTVAQPTDGAQITAGTARELTEDLLKQGLSLVWTQGGKVKNIQAGPINRQKISGFTGNATRTIMADEKRLVASIGVYVSDWGEHNVVPSRFQYEGDVLLIDPEHWSLDWYRSVFSQDLAITGDSRRKQVLGEYGLKASNPWASGIIADLTLV
jgi:hypothetical protein